jgi:hypothetical protein
MSSAVPAATPADSTDVRQVLRSAVQLGVLQSLLVALFAFASRALDGTVETIVLGVLLVIGLAVTIVFPGLATRARSLESVAAAAGVGLAATGVFLVIDVAIFQPIGLYSNRWWQIGGGSNWWYHPVWWMVGTFVPWMGAWALANQAARSGEPSPGGLVVATLVLAGIIMALAAVAGFPGAAFGLGTFALAVLPALVLMVLVTGLGARRR